MKVNDTEVAIYAEGMKKSFGKVEAVKGVDLVLVKGTILALLGPNGAGKTTLVRMLATLLTPDAGRATIVDYNLAKEPQKVRSIIGLSGQYASVDENLTGRENLQMVGRLYHLNKYEAYLRAKELLEMLELTEFADRLVKTYSGGLRRRLDLAASLVAKPQVLFLDEPTTGLDPRSRMALWGVIKNLVRDGTSLLLTTQYMEEADRLADWIAVIDHGLIIEQGTAAELKSKMGGDVLEMHIAERDQTVAVAKALVHLGTDKPQIEEESGKISLPVKNAGVITEAVRILDSLKVTILDIAVRRPSLDDVFLALTGRHSEEKKNS